MSELQQILLNLGMEQDEIRRLQHSERMDQIQRLWAERTGLPRDSTGVVHDVARRGTGELRIVEMTERPTLLPPPDRPPPPMKLVKEKSLPPPTYPPPHEEDLL
jgi:hypothetical protein